MMTTRYYKIDDSEALSTWRKFLADKEAMLDAAKPLAERFNGRVLSVNSVSDSGFAGIALNERPENPDLWTKPDRKNANIQRPRKSVPAALRPVLKELTDEWDRLYPDTTRISKEPLYEALGFDWSRLLFSGAFEIFEYEGVLWVSLGFDLDSGQEILGSEYDAKRKAYREEERQVQTGPYPLESPTGAV